VRGGITLAVVMALCSPAQQSPALNERDAQLLNTAYQGDTASVAELLMEGANVDARHVQDGRTALAIAAEAGHPDTAALLIAKGANLETKDDFGNTALIRSAKKGQASTVKLLLEKGANPDASDAGGETVLMAASSTFQASVDVTELVLQKKVQTEAKDVAGQTALMYAASAGNARTARLLLDHGASIEVRGNEGNTPLIDAAFDTEIGDTAGTVAALLAAGAKTEVRNRAGLTALIAAGWSGNIDGVRLLLERGADRNAKDREGKTALDYARENNRREVVGLLERAR
jgi:ankyrin repeat protein